MFKNDCTTPFESAEYFSVAASEPTSSQPDGFVQFNTTLEVNVTAVNGTTVWNAFTDGTRGGWVEACVETALIFEDSMNLGNAATQEKITFKNNILNISVSLSLSFEVDNIEEVIVVREEAENESVDSDYSQFITAYECDEANLYAPKTSSAYNQGDEIIVCVTDDSPDVVQVGEFLDLTVHQSGNTQYNFINNGVWNPAITTVECVDGVTSSDRRVCYAKIRILARFFSSGTPSDLFITGLVFVNRDGRRIMRKLRSNKNDLDGSSRRVEKNNAKGEFELTIALENTNDSATSSGILESTPMRLMAMAVGAAGAALMV